MRPNLRAKAAREAAARRQAAYRQAVRMAERRTAATGEDPVVMTKRFYRMLMDREES